MPKLTTWVIRNAVATIHPKAAALTDTAITVTGDSIVKNNKPTDGKTINLTVAHTRQSDFTFAVNDETKEVTIKRSEGSRGRKPRKATPTADLTAFLSRIQK